MWNMSYLVNDPLYIIFNVKSTTLNLLWRSVDKVHAWVYDGIGLSLIFTPTFKCRASFSEVYPSLYLWGISQLSLNVAVQICMFCVCMQTRLRAYKLTCLRPCKVKKLQGISLLHPFFAWVFMVICCCAVRPFHYLLTLCPLSPESKQMNAVSSSNVSGRHKLF